MKNRIEQIGFGGKEVSTFAGYINDIKTAMGEAR
jgi:hypothetical protein